MNKFSETAEYKIDEQIKLCSYVVAINNQKEK